MGPLLLVLLSLVRPAAAWPDHSVTTDPVLPALRSGAVLYSARWDCQALVLGARGQVESAGGSPADAAPSVRTLEGVVGFRRYLWGGAHAGAWLLPGQATYTGDQGAVQGFSLAAELRVGWRLQPLEWPVVVDVQLPVSTALVQQNRPASATADRPLGFSLETPNVWIGAVWPKRARRQP